MAKKEQRRLLEMLCPYIPYKDASVILEAMSEAKKSLPPSINLRLTLTAYIRHRHTDYERLLTEGYDRDAARHFTLDETNAILRKWGCQRQVNETEAE